MSQSNCVRIQCNKSIAVAMCTATVCGVQAAGASQQYGGTTGGSSSSSNSITNVSLKPVPVTSRLAATGMH